MGNRTFRQRRADRRDRIVERIQFLCNCLCRPEQKEGRHRRDTMERSALIWALEEIDRLDKIAEALASNHSDDHVLLMIGMIIDSRDRPTENDRERTPQLARMYGPDAAIKE